MKRIFIVKHRRLADMPNTARKQAVKHGVSSLHQSKGRSSFHFIHGWFAHGTLDRF